LIRGANSSLDESLWGILSSPVPAQLIVQEILLLIGALPMKGQALGKPAFRNGCLTWGEEDASQ
jgi:hypothetical protein